MAQKLELTWVGKNDLQAIEPRILLLDKNLSVLNNNTSLLSEGTSDNMLIHGDNYLALKALEKSHAGKVKCIYIDPPYNINAVNEYYDDLLEHSLWLTLMRGRLILLRKLLTDDGVIFIQINDDEQAYLKVLCDEIFGRDNFINMICVKAKASSGASGGGEDRKLKKNIEYILVYSRSDKFESFKPLYKKKELIEYIKEREEEGKNFAYKSVLVDPGIDTFVGTTLDGSGAEIKLLKKEKYVIKSISQLMKEEGISQKQVYEKYIDKIFTLENAQTSIRGRVIEAVGSGDDYYIARYTPRTGRNKGKEIDVGFYGKTKRLVSFLNVLCVKDNNKIYKLDKVGTLWDDMSWSNVKNEGNVDFPNSKKPEALIQRIIEMCTEKNDIVLDSFLGSGTTCAVAHKMGRRWIGIEMGDHAYSHCKVRMDKIIMGQDQSGISKKVGWSSGGGYNFYELAPTLINIDVLGEPIINNMYSPEMLASSVALHEGFKYSPDESVFWKQSKSNENAYLFVTTKHVSDVLVKEIFNQMADDEFLVIACKSFDKNAASYSNRIRIKKIPQMLLGKCEFGRDNYNFDIINPPVYEDEEDDYE